MVKKNSPSRRKVLKSIGAGAALTGLSGVAVAKSSYTKKSRKQSELKQIIEKSEQYKAFKSLLSNEGYNLDLSKARPNNKGDSKSTESIAIPAFQKGGSTTWIKALEAEDGLTLSGTTDNLYHVSNPATLTYADNQVYTTATVSRKKFNKIVSVDGHLPHVTEFTGSSEGQISIQNHYSDVLGIGWSYGGTYDEDSICDLIIGVDVFFAIAGAIGALLADDVTIAGIVDNALIPVVVAGAGGAAVACTIEDLAEEYFAGYLDCSKYVYEIYWPKVYNPYQKPIVVPKCG